MLQISSYPNLPLSRGRGVFGNSYQRSSFPAAMEENQRRHLALTKRSSGIYQERMISASSIKSQASWGWVADRISNRGNLFARISW